MEQPVFTVQHGNKPPVVPPPAPHHVPGQMMEVQGRGMRAGAGGGSRRPVVIGLIVFIGVTVGFAIGAYRARHSARDLAISIISYWLFLVVACCVVKLRQLRRRQDLPATAAELRRVRIGASVASAAMGAMVTARVAIATHGLAAKIVVVAVFILLHSLGIFFFFLRKGKGADRRSDAEELSPAAEERV